ncbi:MAG TPA: helix-turn-helix transcriptional regulator [Longimicrobiales bacterium]|jgi:DNA-binding PadR family transcriptional regulator
MVTLNETEQLVLLSVARLGTDAYGVTVRREIAHRIGRPVSITAVYAALDRMERRGLARSWLSDPTPERGGRARKQFELTPAGADALVAQQRAMGRMWEGVDLGAYGVEG